MYKYYVYGHYTDDGDLFYIGKGTGDRAYTNGRNNVHNRIAKMYGCNVRILLDYLTEKEALFVENEFMRNAYERKIILTNADYIDLNEKPTDDELFSFVQNILLRKVLVNVSSISIIDLEGQNNFNPLLFLAEVREYNEDVYDPLTYISEVRPFHFIDNISTLNLIQKKVIYALGLIMQRYGMLNIKLPLDVLIELINCELEESLDFIYEPIGNQTMFLNTENFTINESPIQSFYVSPKHQKDKYIWIVFQSTSFLIDDVNVSDVYLKRLSESFDVDTALKIYDNINDFVLTLEYFDKYNR